MMVNHDHLGIIKRCKRENLEIIPVSFNLQGNRTYFSVKDSTLKHV